MIRVYTTGLVNSHVNQKEGDINVLSNAFSNATWLQELKRAIVPISARNAFPWGAMLRVAVYQ